MAITLDKDQIDDLLNFMDVPYRPWKDNSKQICCPVHGENNPSCGVSADKQVFHCFSCGAKGDFASLLVQALPDQFKYLRQAREFLADRYELEYRELDGNRIRRIKRYEERAEEMSPKDERVVQPIYKLAPFRSGKETYKYFFNRGFSKQDMVDFNIGRDLENKTVTIPIYYQDGKLAGVIGRYISSKRKKNERYKVYDFNKGNLLYPIHKYESPDGVMILCEGNFDSMWLHKHGYTNALATMGVELTKAQINLIVENCHTVIDIGDNDERGKDGQKERQKKLQGKVNYLIVDYPEQGKDPQEWDKETIDWVIASAHSPVRRRIKRM